MGTMTDPVIGAGSWPAWIAKVSKPKASLVLVMSDTLREPTGARRVPLFQKSVTKISTSGSVRIVADVRGVAEVDVQYEA